MAEEQFFYPETRPLFKKLEELSQRSNVSRGQAFEDFLTAMVCALAAETKEDEYMAMIERHKSGRPGKRGADLLAEMFGELVNAMSESDADILGDLFQGSITYGEAGQYFTPESVSKLMAALSVDPDARATSDEALYIHDPACGTGRMLLDASNINPDAELVGVDVDARCAKITAINVGLRGRYGWVVCGNSLTRETQFTYRVGSFYHKSENGLRRGVIRDVPPEATPVPMIAKQTQVAAHQLFDAEKDEGEEADSAAPALPTVIEVPQWLARLEAKLATLEREERDASEERPKPTNPSPDDPPATQRELF